MSKNSQKAKRSQGQRPGPSKKTAKKLNGSGTKMAPVAISTQMNYSKPKIKNLVDSKFVGIVVKHHEFIEDINASSLPFQVVDEIALNPGLVDDFPWLSIVAQGWEKYRFKRLSFHYITRSPTSSAGAVILAPEYDASDSIPNSEHVLTSYQGAVESAVWRDLVCTLLPSSLHNRGEFKYVRTGPLSANQDIKMYDSGKLFIGTSGTVVSTVGKLWVDYEIELIIPQLPPKGPPQSLSGFTSITNTAAKPLGTAANSLSNFQSGINPVSGTYDGAANTLQMNRCVIGNTYLIAIRLAGTGIVTLGTFSGTTGATMLNDFGIINAAATAANSLVYFRATDEFPLLTMSAATATTITTAQVTVGNNWFS